MTNTDKLLALMGEARRRGVTYGELSARLTPEETQEVYDRYMGRAQKVGKPAKAAAKEKAKKQKVWGFDAGKAKELYRAGYFDVEIGRLLGVDTSIIWRWRHGEGLPAVQRYKPFLEEEAKRLYSLGMNDREIGERIGKSVTAISQWRLRKGLPAQRRRGNT